MRVGILSDIHVDINNKEGNSVEDAILKTLDEKNVDILIIAGDVSSDYQETLRVLNDFQQRSRARILFVPGNHDIWNKSHADMDTWEIYDALSEFSGSLIRENIVINDWAFVGDIGWYDYSFGSNEYKEEDFYSGKAFKSTWQDKKYVNWQKSDIEVTDLIYSNLKERLELVKDKSIILVTHMLIDERFIVPESQEIWKYFNAFLGSDKYQKLVDDYNIRYAIMGHVHYRKRATTGKTEYICNCLNYRSQWINKEDAFKEVQKAMTVIVI